MPQPGVGCPQTPRLQASACNTQRGFRKENGQKRKGSAFSANFVRSQVLYWAAQEHEFVYLVLWALLRHEWL